MPGLPQRRRTNPTGAPNAHPDSPATGGGPAVGPARLWIDWTACDARGWCAELLPELLTRDPDGYPLAHAPGAETTRTITVPAPLAGHARRAADACPRLALRLLPDG